MACLATVLFFAWAAGGRAETETGIDITSHEVWHSLARESTDQGKLAVLEAATAQNAFNCFHIREFLGQLTMHSKFRALKLFTSTSACTGTSAMILPAYCCAAIAEVMPDFFWFRAQKLCESAVPAMNTQVFPIDGSRTSAAHTEAVSPEGFEELCMQVSLPDSLPESILRGDFTSEEVLKLARVMDHESLQQFAEKFDGAVTGLTCAELAKILQALHSDSERLSFVRVLLRNIVDPRNMHKLIREMKENGSKTATANILSADCKGSSPNAHGSKRERDCLVHHDDGELGNAAGNKKSRINSPSNQVFTSGGKRQFPDDDPASDDDNKRVKLSLVPW